MLIYQLAIVAGMFALKAMTWLYWRSYILPSFKAQGCDLAEYARRRSSWLYFSYGILGLMFIYMVLLFVAPDLALSFEGEIVFFFLLIVSFCLNLLGVGGGLRYLKEKQVNVTPFGKAVLVFEDAIYVVGMVAYVFLSTRESIQQV